MEQKDGGPAFPIADPFTAHQPGTADDAKRLAEGMTLIDYFAARIAPEILRQFSTDGTMREHPEWRQGVAVEAYRIAGEMIERRRQGASNG